MMSKRNEFAPLGAFVFLFFLLFFFFVLFFFVCLYFLPFREDAFSDHYESMTIQKYRKFRLQKLKIYRLKN